MRGGWEVGDEGVLLICLWAFYVLLSSSFIMTWLGVFFPFFCLSFLQGRAYLHVCMEFGYSRISWNLTGDRMAYDIPTKWVLYEG